LERKLIKVEENWIRKSVGHAMRRSMSLQVPAKLRMEYRKTGTILGRGDFANVAPEHPLVQITTPDNLK
jgi:hypothetical protein